MCGCSDPDLAAVFNYPVGVSSVDYDDAPTFSLESSALFTSDSLGSPADLIGNEDRLLVAELTSAPPLQLFDRTTGEPVGFVGSRGDGPQQFMRPWSMAPAADGSVMVYDPVTRRVSTVDLSSDLSTDLSSGDPNPIRAQWVLNVEGFVLNVAPVGSGRFLVNGIFSDERLAVVDSTGSKLQTIGTSPVPEFGQAADSQAEAKVRPGGGDVVLALHNADVLEFYDPSSGLERVVWGPDHFEPEQNRTGYSDVAVTEDFVFGLYSGRPDADDSSHLGSTVLVFDWDGKFVAQLQLDADGYGIWVDPEAGELFLSQHIPAPGIAEYRLPGALSGR